MNHLNRLNISVLTNVKFHFMSLNLVSLYSKKNKNNNQKQKQISNETLPNQYLENDDSRNQNQGDQIKNIVQSKSVQMIQKKYEQIQIESFQERTFTNLTKLQKQIIKQNRFDLVDPQIRPKMTTLNSFKGIKTNLTEIDLGKVKIKDKNQVFLSQIDPENIPEEYQIRFDKQKILTVVGKQMDSEGSNLQIGNNKMQISTQQSFQQKNISQISQKYLGFKYKYEYNKKQFYRSWISAILLFYFIGYPIFDTLKEYYECIQSIKSIQSQSMSELTKIKNKIMVKTLLQNKDFNTIV